MINMSSNRQSFNLDGVYLTPQHKVHELIQGRKYESEQIEQEPEYTYELSDPPDPDYSNVYYYEHSNLEDEYVLHSNAENYSLSGKSNSKTTKEERRSRFV